MRAASSVTSRLHKGLKDFAIMGQVVGQQGCAFPVFERNFLVALDRLKIDGTVGL